MKSLSVSIMFFEYSFGKLKYDSTTLPMSGFLGSSPVSASKSPVSLAILNFFIIKFSVWVSPTPTPRTKISIDVPVDRIPGIKSRLEAGMGSPGRIISFGLDVFHAFTIYVLNRDAGLLRIRGSFIQPL